MLVLTTFDLDEYVFEALRAGASGFLLKDTRPTDLLDAIRVVADGEALLSPRVTRRLIAEFAAPARDRPAGGDRADLAVAHRAGAGGAGAWSAGGCPTPRSPSELYVSVATAKTHVSRVLTKLDARDRAQLVVVAYESGLISPGWRRRPPRAYAPGESPVPGG